MKIAKTTRQSNFELMRIISMFFIIVWHVIMFGKILENSGNTMIKLLFLFVEYIVVIHVNSYVLVTGYFQIDSKFKVNKIFKLMNSAWFYKAIIFILLMIFNFIHPTKIEIFNNIFYLDTGQYWFIDSYLLLYCISPFLNTLIHKMDKKNYLKLLAVGGLITSVLPFITGGLAFDNNGSTLYSFIYLYFVGGYLRKNPINDSYIFRKCSKNLKQIIFLSIFVLCIVFNFLIHNFATTLVTLNDITSYFGDKMIYVSLHFSNPIIVIQSIAYFLFFETLDIKSKAINKLSSLMFGVYLIHMNLYLKDFLYKWLKIDAGIIYSCKFILYALLISILILVICCLIEWIRQLIFKFIYERKISSCLRNKFYTWCHDVKILNDNKIENN